MVLEALLSVPCSSGEGEQRFRFASARRMSWDFADQGRFADQIIGREICSSHLTNSIDITTNQIIESEFVDQDDCNFFGLLLTADQTGQQNMEWKIDLALAVARGEDSGALVASRLSVTREGVIPMDALLDVWTLLETISSDGLCKYQSLFGNFPGVMDSLVTHYRSGDSPNREYAVLFLARICFNQPEFQNYLLHDERCEKVLESLLEMIRTGTSEFQTAAFKLLCNLTGGVFYHNTGLVGVTERNLEVMKRHTGLTQALQDHIADDNYGFGRSILQAMRRLEKGQSNMQGNLRRSIQAS